MSDPLESPQSATPVRSDETASNGASAIGGPVPPAPGPLAALPTARRTRAKASDTFILSHLRIENLRGYSAAELRVEGFTVVVGNNNQGKSSILRIADWVLNEADEDVLQGARELRDDETALLLPANQALQRARRFELIFQFDDGRRAKRFGSGSKEVRLRVAVEKTRNRLRLNLGHPRQGETHDARAFALLQQARDVVQFILVPAARDARSTRFRDALKQRLHGLLLTRFEHNRQAGAPAEYRKARNIIGALTKMVERVADDIQADLKGSIPTDLLRSARLTVSAAPADLATWLMDHIVLALSTGRHDEDHVSPVEVGNGLQSTLDVALSLASIDDKAHQVVVALEEPEAFLHPCAQRDLAATLRSLTRKAPIPRRDVLVTTHSPYLLDEARFGETVLARDHTFFHPSQIGDDTKRSEINSTLMTVGAAEIFFSRGVLLVEGPGEQALFWTLLRRIAAKVKLAELSQLTVFPVGGKRRFVPWWRLLSSYVQPGREPPIRWLSLFDSDAASKDDSNQRALLEAIDSFGPSLPSLARTSIVAFGDLPYSNVEVRLAEVTKLNPTLKVYGGAHLLAIDCDWAAFGAYAERQLQIVRHVMERPSASALELARAAGSKAGNGNTSDGARKQPFLRQKLAEQMDLALIPEEILNVLRLWFGLVLPEKEISLAFTALGIK